MLTALVSLTVLMMSLVMSLVITAVYTTPYASHARFISDKDASHNDSALSATNPLLCNTEIR